MGEDKLAPCIMFQGTSSDAGKSVLATALCRILAQDGYRVAPFKAQNMANNSYVTEDGLEIGRAQGVQAEAAGVTAEAAMNPILLKPSSDGVSQIVLLGKAIEETRAASYREDWVPYLWPRVQKALLDLRKKYDFVIMEGAGSPAEINLRKRDLTNMEVAREAGARVVLVSDIEKGGMLASVVGTLELLESWERDLVHGIVVNKFRGDYSLLEPGLDFLEEKTGKPILGVIPYFYESLVEAEDSLSLSRRISGSSKGEEDENPAKIKVGVVNLTRISNFTDFDPLEEHPEIDFKYLPLEKEIDDIDCLVIPGTKASREDLVNFMDSNLYRSIVQNKIFENKPVFGICGGYQMLGKEIKDYEGVEGHPGELNGLGMLPVITEFVKDKETIWVDCSVDPDKKLFFLLQEENIRGYEIHLGNTRVLEDNAAWLFDSSNNSKGVISKDGRIIGTYLHDIFNNANFLQWFLAWVKSWKYNKKATNLEEFYYRNDEKTLGKADDIDRKLEREEKYERLADIVRENLKLSHLLSGMIKS